MHTIIVEITIPKQTWGKNTNGSGKTYSDRITVTNYENDECKNSFKIP